MKDFEQRKRIAVERHAAKVRTWRTKAAAVSNAIPRTCACGRTIKGNGYFGHIKKCVHAIGNEGESK